MLSRTNDATSRLETIVADGYMTNAASERFCSVSRNKQLIGAAKYHKGASR
jgi:hypothetical protein